MADRDRHHRDRPNRGGGDLSGVDAARQLLEEQGRAFKAGGAALESARAQGIGFLYDEDEGGRLTEREKQEREERLEDAIPNLPENAAAREFLKSAPQGKVGKIYMPVGKEVKVMQCWRCKQYGHRTGDRECPLFLTGNIEQDARRQAREDPMSAYVGVRVLKQEEKEARRAQLQAMVDQIRAERREKKRRKNAKAKKKQKRQRKDKKRRKKKESSKKRRRSGSRSSESSGSVSGSDASSSPSSTSDSSSSESSSGSEDERDGRRQSKKIKS